MSKRIAGLLAIAGAAVLIGAAALWPRHDVQAQIGLPAGVADCQCARPTQLDAGASRVFVHNCQCGAMQCVISAGTAGSGSVVPQLAQTCR